MVQMSVRGGRWPLYAGLFIVCAAVVVGAVVMERQTLASSREDLEGKAVGLMTQTVAPLARDPDLTQPLGPTGAKDLSAALEKNLPPSVVRVRLFARNGTLLFSTDDGDRVGASKVGDADAIRGAAAGAPSSVVDDDRVSIDGAGAQSLALLEAYGPIQDRAGKTLGVAELDFKFRPLEDASKQPWRWVQLGAGFLGVLFLELALFGLARATAAKRQADRSGFQAPKVSRAVAKTAEQRSKEEQKEAQVRQALEEQLQTLRTQMKGQQEEAAAAAREFAEQLKAAAARAEEAQARVRESGDLEQRTTAAVERAELLEQRLQQAEHEAQVREARIAELETQLGNAASPEVEVATAGEHELVADGAVETSVVSEVSDEVADGAEVEPAVASEADLVAELEAEVAREREVMVEREPVDEAPAEETLAEEMPADEVPADEAPADKVPADEAPATPHPMTAQPAAIAALFRAAATIRDSNGDAQAVLEEAAAAVFPFVSAGELRGAEVADTLVAAAAEAGLDQEGARRTIAAAFLAARKSA
jgi:hypothetical protein